MPRRASPSPPPAKRRRTGRNYDDGDGDDDDDGRTSTPAAHASSSLSDLVHPTTVIKARSKGKSKGRGPYSHAGHAPPLCAFPRLSTYEATDAPKKARLAGYMRTSSWLSRSFAQEYYSARTKAVASDVAQWIAHLGTTTDAAAASLQRAIPVAALDAGVDIHAVVAQLIGHRYDDDGDDGDDDLAAAASQGTALWATLDAAQAGASPRSAIAACCRSWLRQAHESLGVGSSSSDRSTMTMTSTLPLWLTLCRRYRDLADSRGRPLLLLVLPQMPRPALWETLHYLVNSVGIDDSDVATPHIAVIVQGGTGTGTDAIDTAHRRLLDTTTFSPAATAHTRQDPRLLVEELFLRSVAPIRLPPSLIKYCAIAAAQSCSEQGTGPVLAQSLHQWLELSIQHYLTHDPFAVLGCLELQSPDTSLHAADFTPAFFAQLRHALIGSLGAFDDEDDEEDGEEHPFRRNPHPQLHRLPAHLRSKASLRNLLTDDQSLLDNCGALLALERGAMRARQRGMELLGLANATADTAANTGPTLDTATRFVLLFPIASTGTAASERTLLRKRINDAMASFLRSVKRSESEGGLTIAQLEEWLDRIEDWADTGTAAGQDEQESAWDSRDVALRALLSDVRSLQQKLRLARYGSSGSGGGGGMSGSDTAASDGDDAAAKHPPTPKLTRVQLVERKLKLEEELRGVRREIAEWYAGIVRGMLLPDGVGVGIRESGDARSGSATASATLFDAAREEHDALSRAAAIDALLSPSPRAHITLGLGRPAVYLEAFAASLHLQSEAGGLSAPQARLRTELSAYFFPGTPSEDCAQTDLSIAYNLLREAGGAGTGVKGRLVNVFDWYQAWTLGVKASERARARARAAGGAGENQGNGAVSKADQADADADAEAAQKTPRAKTATPGKRGPGRPPKKRANDDGDDGDGDDVGGASLQARFALAMSTLALLGYIKKTRKGRAAARNAADDGAAGAGGGAGAGGEVYVLKVGGWDVLPGAVE